MSAGIRWIDGEDAGFEGYWVIAARGIGPKELLLRAGCTGEEMHLTWQEGAVLEGDTGVTVLRAGHEGEWAFCVADYGPVFAPGAQVDTVVRRVSRGAEALELTRTTNFDTGFTYALDGRTVCTFDPLTDPEPRGSNPGILVPELIRVGLLDSAGIPVELEDLPNENPLALTHQMVEEFFGLSIPRELLTGRFLSMRLSG